MEKNNNEVAFGSFPMLWNEAHRLIEEVLAPTFQMLEDSYPEAVNWDVAIGVYEDGTYYEIITLANIEPEEGADNPGDSVLCEHCMGDEIIDILNEVSRILKEEPNEYGITVEDIPYEGEELKGMYFYTKNNT